MCRAPQNVGDAITEGLELEAKFRASDVIEGAPRIDVRANASFFHSQGEGRARPRQPARPAARLHRQPRRRLPLRRLPLTLGGNLNWTPGYLTRLTDVQTATIGRKLVVDAYGLWTFNPALALRLSLSNLDPREYVTGSGFDGPDISGVPVRETSRTTAPTFINVQLRLELKL